jgi:hypothetical protein
MKRVVPLLMLALLAMAPAAQAQPPPPLDCLDDEENVVPLVDACASAVVTDPDDLGPPVAACDEEEPVFPLAVDCARLVLDRYEAVEEWALATAFWGLCRTLSPDPCGPMPPPDF